MTNGEVLDTWTRRRDEGPTRVRSHPVFTLCPSDISKAALYVSRISFSIHTPIIYVVLNIDRSIIL